MATVSLSPDDLVEHLIEEIIIGYMSSAKLPQIWTIVCNRLNKTSLSDVYKSLIWSWLIKKQEIEVHNNDVLFSKDDDLSLDKLIANGVDKLVIKVEEGKQWLYLTNRPKEGNPIGVFPFSLLKVIISKREKGISGADLSKAANQDPRSLTSRLAILEKEGLIKKRSADMPGTNTSLVIHTKFYNKIVAESLPTFSMASMKKQIVDVIKNSKNQIRTSSDVAAELGYSKPVFIRKRFKRMVKNLCVLGYLRPVLVAPPHNETARATTRALMYIKDYQLEKDSGDEDDDEDEEEEEEEEGTADVSMQADASLLQQDNLNIMADDYSQSAANDDEIPTLNTHFPVLSQISEVVRFSGSKGISAMAILKTIAGSNGASWFARYVADLKFNFASPEHLSNYSIVKALDADGKVKFYRYFTQEEYSKITGAHVSPAAGAFSELVIKDDPPLVRLSLQFAKDVANGGLELVHCPDGVDRLYWTGITDPLIRHLYQQQVKRQATGDILTSTRFVNDSTNEVVAILKERLTAAQVKRLAPPEDKPSSSRGRGRPKKVAPSKRSASADEDEQQLKKQKSVTPETAIKYQPRQPSEPIFPSSESKSNDLSLSGVFETMPRPSKDLSSEYVDRSTPAVVKSEEPVEFKFDINFTAFGGSIRSNQRRQQLLELIKEKGGLAILNSALAREVGRRMNSSTLVDKATLKKDALALKNNGQIETVQFKERLRDGEEGQKKTVLISVADRPTDDEIKNFIEENINYTTVRSAVAEPEPEVFRVPVEFKNVEAPKAFLPRMSALERKLTEVKPSKASFTSKRSVTRNKNAATESSGRKSHKKVQNKGKATIPKEEVDPLLSYLSNMKEFKRKVRTKKSTGKKTESTSAKSEVKRQSLDLEYVVSAAKAHTMVTSLQFNKILVDWTSIGKLLNEDPDKTRRRWPHIRKQLKFVTLPRIKESWERFLDISVKNGNITYDMLANSDFKAMYDLWNESEFDNFEDDELLLFSNYKDNFIDQNFTRQPEDKINFSSLPSSLEKTRYITNIAFTNAVDATALTDDKYDKVKAVLKSIFATDIHDFDPKRSRKILKDAGDYFPALKELEISKEIAYLGENSETKFTIPEKTWLAFQQKINATFLEDASTFLKVFAEIVEAGKGMILSAMTPDSSIATILHLLVEKKMKIILIDKIMSKKLSGYFTRSFNVQLLEVDFVLTAGSNKQVLEPLPEVIVPMGEPCSRIWIDMKGSLKGELWKTLLSTIIHHIYFRPGVDLSYLYENTRTLLQLFELREVLQWLIDKKAVVQTGNGYFILPNFLTVIG